MAEDMQIRNHPATTIRCYTSHVEKFTQYFDRPAKELGPEEIRQFQLHLINERKVGWSTFNQTVSALRFLYRFTIPQDWPVTMIPFGKRPRKLPTVLGNEEVTRFLVPVSHFSQVILRALPGRLAGPDVYRVGWYRATLALIYLPSFCGVVSSACPQSSVPFSTSTKDDRGSEK